MKAGTESRTKTGFAVVLGIIALLLVLRAYFGGATPENPATPARQTTKTTGKPFSSLDPTLRTDLLRSAEDTKYEGKGRNIFMAQAEPLPQPTKQVFQQQPQPQVPQGPPPPPPINMKFIGFASKPGEQKKIFLMQNEDVFVATEGEIVNRRYKIVKINPNNVEIEDVLNTNHQSIPLTQS